MITVPERSLVTICEDPRFENSVKLVVAPMKGDKRRNWFNPHAYFCLPLLIGNQYGFGIRSLKEFSAVWNGRDTPQATKVKILDEGEEAGWQRITSNFGLGIVTIQNRFTFRTPPGVNLMTINPPNYWIDGIHHMTAVVETDNLRRDFTFNLKLTRPHHEVRIKKGDLIGCVLPVPRYFVDSFHLEKGEAIFSETQITEERQAMRDFGKARSTVDKDKPRGNGRLYLKGEDVYGNPFSDHQVR